MKEECGMNPLLIAFRPREWTELGRKNLENLKNKLNVDCIEFTPKRELYKQIQKVGLQDFGDASWPEHIGIFTVPIQIAVKFNIPLVIWGENNQAEYGGPLEDQNKPFQDIDWHKKYGESIYVKNQMVHFGEINFRRLFNRAGQKYNEKIGYNPDPTSFQKGKSNNIWHTVHRHFRIRCSRLA